MLTEVCFPHFLFRLLSVLLRDLEAASLPSPACEGCGDFLPSPLFVLLAS